MICEQTSLKLGPLPEGLAEQRHQNENSVHLAAMEGLEDDRRKCSKCGELKIESEFHIRRDTGKYRKDCKRCVNNRKAIWQKDNIQHVMALQKKWREEKSKDPAFVAKYKKIQADYSVKAREKIYTRRKANKHLTADRDREYIRVWMGNKRRTDPQYNIGNRLRSRLWHAVTSQNGKKAFKTMELVGCTVAELRVHLEKQFTEGMTWEVFMQGKIHIDHIRPCAAFQLTDPAQQKECFHWKNLQPLWALENISKGCKISE